ncbi:hypothetical protein [Nocardioides sp. SR21]|uniref:hypothetical protein n=1 Tax=Nocardioides sp. SR21 TaxID=2919501 RepID=UPI001FAABC9F|nr:hypothetical protein [Nocardioides sp. SR21]
MTTMATHTMTHGDWFPQHAWDAGSTSIGGRCEDGTRVDVVTHRDAEYRTHQQRAWNEWLHGRVLMVTRDDAPPALVLPVDQITVGAINLAVSAWATGHASAIAA